MWEEVLKWEKLFRKSVEVRTAHYQSLNLCLSLWVCSTAGPKRGREMRENADCFLLFISISHKVCVFASMINMVSFRVARSASFPTVMSHSDVTSAPNRRRKCDWCWQNSLMFASVHYPNILFLDLSDQAPRYGWEPPQKSEWNICRPSYCHTLLSYLVLSEL